MPAIAIYALSGVSDGGAGLLRLCFANSVRQVIRGVALQAIGQVPGQQLVEDDPQRVNVGCRGDDLAAKLLGAGKLRRHHAHRSNGGVCFWRIGFGAENGCNAEVEQFGDAIGSNQNVAGFNVAVHNQPLVCILHRRTYTLEKIEASGRSQLAFIAIFINGLPSDETHDKVGMTFVRGAAIEQAGNILMLKAGQNLTLFPEARVDKLRIQSLPHQFDGDLFFAYWSSSRTAR